MITAELLKNIDDRTLRWYRKQVAQLDQECVRFNRCYLGGDPQRIIHGHFKELEKMLTAEINEREQRFRELGIKKAEVIDWSRNLFCCAQPVIEDPDVLAKARELIEELDDDSENEVRYCPYCGNESAVGDVQDIELYECEACERWFFVREKKRRRAGDGA